MIPHVEQVIFVNNHFEIFATVILHCVSAMLRTISFVHALFMYDQS